jgi:hypothetical protein
LSVLLLWSWNVELTKYLRHGFKKSIVPVLQILIR